MPILSPNLAGIVIAGITLIPLAPHCAGQQAPESATGTNPVIDRLRTLAREAPVVVAHRGKSDTHPENTLPAIEAALACGAQMVEFDVHQTSDGVWMCIHDVTLDRTTDSAEAFGKAGVRIDAIRHDELVRLDAGSWKHARFAATPLPSLDAALEVIHKGGALAMVEHKSGSAADMVEFLRKRHLVDRVLVQSFDWDFVREVHRLEPRIALGALGPNSAARKVDKVDADTLTGMGASMVHWRDRDLTVEALNRFERAGLLVCTYTTDDDMGLIGLASAGVHMVTTNRPARMVELRDRGHLGRRSPRRSR